MELRVASDGELDAWVAVWNETMKRQAVEIHGYRPEQVCVAGVPQFDNYARPESFQTREAFFKGAINLFQRDAEMKSIVLTDAQAREHAIRHFFNRALRAARA